MVKVTLYARNGEEVIQVSMPPFLIPPEVILWGSRYFVLREGKYIEGMCWPIIEGGF